MSNVLTFDLGTTYFKACVFDAGGRLLALARRNTPVTDSSGERREIEPGRFLDTIVHLAAEVHARAPDQYREIEAISVATQTNSFLLLDSMNRPLTPLILWNDRRAASLESRFAELLADPSLRAESGVPSLSGGFALLKLLWLREHQPSVWREARRFCLIGDWLTWWLTGRHITEGGAAGLTGLLDVHTMGWRRAFIDRCGLADLTLPEPGYAGGDIGRLQQALADQLGLRRHTRCTLGCLDQYAGAIGAGNVERGGISETTGTVLATVALSDRFDAALPPSVFQGPAWRAGLWWRMSFGSLSANLLEALRESEPDEPSYERLDAEAASVRTDGDGLRLDAVASLARSHPVFENAGPHHSRGHRVLAIFEAVAGALRRQTNDLGSDVRAPILAAGGAARSRLWLQIKADTLGIPFAATACPEPTSLGAAAFAIASLTGESLEATVRRVVSTAETIAPRATAND